MKYAQITTAEDYIDVVRKFSFLLNQEFSIIENGEINIETIDKIPFIISLVNTIECFRWQESLFLNFRPKEVTAQFQSELYSYEQDFNNRFDILRQRIRDSDLYDEYKKKLERYFIQFRL